MLSFNRTFEEIVVFFKVCWRKYEKLKNTIIRTADLLDLKPDEVIEYKDATRLPRWLNTDKEYGPYTAVYSRNTASKRPDTVQYGPFTRRTSP